MGNHPVHGQLLLQQHPRHAVGGDKDDTGFRVDGKPVTGLSGSTLDALGLAIRIALTKTFLPNNDFMILDEPGAACDDNREASMLGTISTAGFAQVLLVTHSVLADTFADNVIQL